MCCFISFFNFLKKLFRKWHINGPSEFSILQISFQLGDNIVKASKSVRDKAIKLFRQLIQYKEAKESMENDESNDTDDNIEIDDNENRDGNDDSEENEVNDDNDISDDNDDIDDNDRTDENDTDMEDTESSMEDQEILGLLKNMLQEAKIDTSSIDLNKLVQNEIQE